MVRELLAASGGTFSNPATNFYQIETDTLKTAENVAQVFMGIRIQCAQCHNHPFDRWTMDDYYSFAAFFCQIGRKQGEDYRETIVFNRGGGEVKHPVGGRVMEPKFLGGAEPDVKGKDRREVLADWLTVAGESVLRPQRGQPRLGPLLRAWASSSRSTTSASATRPAIRSCSQALGKQARRVQVRLQAAGARHLQLAGLPARRPSATPATPATSGTSPTPGSGGSGPRCCSTASAR